MPIPKPQSGEKQDDFISRCNAELASEYPDTDQRNAVCFDAWKNKDKKNMSSEDINYIIHDREIMAVGTWNGDKFTENDLQEIANNFNLLGFKIPLKLGHSDKVGEQAFGIVENVRKVGKKLIADFVNIPKEIYEKIKNKNFLSVSSEIFFNLKRNGKVFKRALAAVSLLGSEIPAVDLAPVYEGIENYSQLEYELIKTTGYKMETEEIVESEEVKKLKLELAQAQKDLEETKKNLSQSKVDDEKIKKLQAEHEQTIKKLEQIGQERRKEKVDLKMAAVNVPAYCDFLRPLYQAALESDQVRKYSIDGKETEGSLQSIVDGLIDRINKDSEGLFKQYSTPDELKRGKSYAQNKNEAGEELAKLATLKAKDEKIDFSAAMQEIIRDPKNADLVSIYNAI